jgi:hypothetical protein
MGLVHSISLCDYDTFQASVLPVVVSLQEGNLEPLKRRAIMASHRLRLLYRTIPIVEDTQNRAYDDLEWHFRYHGDGGSVPKAEAIQIEGEPSPQRLGEWFRLILGEFLYPPFPVSTTWGLVAEALQVMGWSQTDTNLFFIGEPMITLVGGKEAIADLVVIEPFPARKAGLLRTENIIRFRSQFAKLHDEIHAFDVRLFPFAFDREDPILVRDYKKWLIEGYESLLFYYDTAIRADLGIITTISLSG